MEHYKIGYTQGVFDMFHVGHLNLLNHAKERCDYLIVGVNSDRLVEAYKNKKTVVCEQDRMAIVGAIRSVNAVLIVDTLDKMVQWEKMHFDVLFIGDDWKGNERWQRTEEELEKVGAVVCYLPHTPGISSTILRARINHFK